MKKRKQQTWMIDSGWLLFVGDIGKSSHVENRILWFEPGSPEHNTWQGEN